MLNTEYTSDITYYHLCCESKDHMRLKILFLCTHNACRSILSEAIARELAGEYLEVASAGSHQSGHVHPLTLSYLAQRGYQVSNLSSKGIDELKNFNPDIVVTVCDQAARESCPVWLGSAIKAHWGLPDPSHLNGAEQEVDQAFNAVIDTIEARISRLRMELSLGIKKPELKEIFDQIGEQN